MRRIFSFIIASLIATLGFGQTCISDQNIKDVGFHPKTIATAYVDSNYKQVLQVRIFKDTSVLLNGNPVLATIDSIVVTGMAGMPSGFYYTCAHKNCTFIPDSTGCATLQGIANKSDIGEHQLDIQIKIYAKIFGTVSTTQEDTIRQFTMVVDDLSNATLIDKSSNYLYPNPSNSNSISVSQPLFGEIAEVTCINSVGQFVDYKINNGKIELLHGASGLHTISITTTSGQTFSQRVLFTQ
jgi:hypothetical protein